MHEENRSAIIISASSDTGISMSRRWLAKGWKVAGTYRTGNSDFRRLQEQGFQSVYCDLSDKESVDNACTELQTLCPQWDVLVLCPAILDPIGPFINCDFEEWSNSLQINFTEQMRFIHNLLPFRQTGLILEPLVLLFAGGGTNSAPQNYSAYTISKIAQIKMCELLDAEMPDTRFAIVGPGWVKTKIHQSTIEAGVFAGDNYQRTISQLASDSCTPMEQILDCCDWLVNSKREVVSGRNFSVVYDDWGAEQLDLQLAQDTHMYKLRRHGN